MTLAGAIERMTNDRSLGQRLGRAGYERARKLFSIEKNVSQLCALLAASVVTRLPAAAAL